MSRELLEGHHLLTKTRMASPLSPAGPPRSETYQANHSSAGPEEGRNSNLEQRGANEREGHRQFAQEKRQPHAALGSVRWQMLPPLGKSAFST
jgi:hypothetical protein